jgi:hypothetical protein
MPTFANGLKERLMDEDIKAVTVRAQSVDVRGGHLAVILTLTSPNSSHTERLKAERIANEECVKYLQDRRKTVK